MLVVSPTNAGNKRPVYSAWKNGRDDDDYDGDDDDYDDIL